MKCSKDLDNPLFFSLVSSCKVAIEYLWDYIYIHILTLSDHSLGASLHRRKSLDDDSRCINVYPTCKSTRIQPLKSVFHGYKTEACSVHTCAKPKLSADQQSR